MQIRKNILSIIAIFAVVSLFILGFKTNENVAKETIILTCDNSILITYSDGKQEVIEFEKDKSVTSIYWKTVVLTLNRLNKSGYEVKASSQSISSQSGVLRRDFILEK